MRGRPVAMALLAGLASCVEAGAPKPGAEAGEAAVEAGEVPPDCALAEAVRQGILEDCAAATYGGHARSGTGSFVCAAASEGGDGTLAAPFRTIAEARAAGATVLWLAAGEHSADLRLEPGAQLALHGACPADLRLQLSPGDDADIVVPEGAELAVEGMEVVGTGPLAWVEGALELHNLELLPGPGEVLRVGGAGTATLSALTVAGVAEGAFLALDGAASVALEAVTVELEQGARLGSVGDQAALRWTEGGARAGPAVELDSGLLVGGLGAAELHQLTLEDMVDVALEAAEQAVVDVDEVEITGLRGGLRTAEGAGGFDQGPLGVSTEGLEGAARFRALSVSGLGGTGMVLHEDGVSQLRGVTLGPGLVHGILYLDSAVDAENLVIQGLSDPGPGHIGLMALRSEGEVDGLVVEDLGDGSSVSWGVWASEGAALTVRDAHLRQVRGQGVLVSEGAALELDGAVFEHTLVAGESAGRAVEVKQRSRAVVRGAELWNTEGAAFFVQGSSAKLEVFDSVVSQTQTVGEGYTTIAAFANGGGALELTDVIFTDQHGIGLLAYDTDSSITTDRVTVERTFIDQHGQDGWAIAALGPARLDLRDTTVRSFYGAGVLVAGATARFSQLRLEDGQRGMELTDPPAVTVQGGGLLVGEGLQVHQTEGPALYIEDEGAAVLEDLEATDYVFAGVVLGEGSLDATGLVLGEAPGADTGVFVQPRRSGATLALSEADIAAHGFAAVFLTEPAEVHIAGSVLRGGPGRQPGTEGPLLHGNALFVGNESAGTGTICVEHSTLADSRVGVLLHGVDPALLACPEPGGLAWTGNAQDLVAQACPADAGSPAWGALPAAHALCTGEPQSLWPGPRYLPYFLEPEAE